MKRWLIVVATAVLLWLITTGTVSALPDCLKDPAFCRTGVGEARFCDNICDDRGTCRKATVTLWKLDGTDSLWLTSLHAVAGAEQIWVDDRIATVEASGCFAGQKLTCEHANKFGCNWAMLRVKDYVPCCVCPLVPRFEGPCCGEELFFVDIGKCGTVVKCHVVELPVDSEVFYTNTQPDCWNCGAVAYDHCGRAVGILVGDDTAYCSDECDSCGKVRRTEFIRLSERMFSCLDEDEPDEGLEIPAAPV